MDTKNNMQMNTTFSELRELMAKCEAIKAQKALGDITNLRLSKLQSRAKKHIEQEIGDIIKDKEKALSEIAISKTSEHELRSSEEYKEWEKGNKEIWTEDTEFEFAAVEVSLKDDVGIKFKDDKYEFIYSTWHAVVNPYLALFELEEKGFITIKEA